MRLIARNASKSSSAIRSPVTTGPSANAATIAPSNTDELHAMLVKRADDLEGCPTGSDEAREPAAVECAISAYEAVRWPRWGAVRRPGIGRGFLLYSSRVTKASANEPASLTR